MVFTPASESCVCLLDQGVLLRNAHRAGRGLLPGSVSHPWLTRRREPSMARYRNPRPARRTEADSARLLPAGDSVSTRSRGANGCGSGLTAGSRVERAMDGARPSQGRVSRDGVRGTAAHPCERHACFAWPDRAAALTEGRAATGWQAAAHPKCGSISQLHGPPGAALRKSLSLVQVSRPEQGTARRPVRSSRNCGLRSAARARSATARNTQAPVRRPWSRRRSVP